MMSKLLIGLLGAGVIASGGYAAASGLDDSQPARTVSLPGATTSDDTTTGVTTTQGTTTAATTAAATTAAVTTVENEVEDVSGPCDEAEHANDARCTGVATAGDDTRDDNGGDDKGGDDDRSGSGKGSDDGSDDHGGDDRSGSNSGKG